MKYDRSVFITFECRMLISDYYFLYSVHVMPHIIHVVQESQLKKKKRASRFRLQEEDTQQAAMDVHSVYNRSVFSTSMVSLSVIALGYALRWDLCVTKQWMECHRPSTTVHLSIVIHGAVLEKRISAKQNTSVFIYILSS